MNQKKFLEFLYMHSQIFKLKMEQIIIIIINLINECLQEIKSIT